jgi:hypothetical protein
MQMPAVAIGIMEASARPPPRDRRQRLAQRRCCAVGTQQRDWPALTLLRLTPEHERVVLRWVCTPWARSASFADWLSRIGIVAMWGPLTERLGTIERIAEAKAELVRALLAAEDGGCISSTPTLRRLWPA